ncbi:DUF4142 domain-containing protein [Pseudoduganella sp. GCM10020061]|uniref:DUF4142 domain-containing protein n=1 Tax=Pseudoduganella sp. GCM10020061 TaxID=3317345 RepID=UPI003629B83B
MKPAILIAALALALGGTAHAQAPNDAEIAAIVVAANTVDINAGQLARKKGSTKAVRDFGQRMVTDHTGVNEQAAALVKKLGVTPQDNATSNSLTDGGRATMDKLNKLSGAHFDKAYVDNEVTYHQAVLDTIDKTLIPNAKNAELKALIVKVRPAIDAHLQHAKHMQSSMK